MLKELSNSELAFLSGNNHYDDVIGISVSKITFNYSKTIERDGDFSIKVRDFDKLINDEILQLTLEMYSLNIDTIINKDKCDHITVDISMNRAEYREFCDNIDTYYDFRFDPENTCDKDRFPGIKNVFLIDELPGQGSFHNTRHLFSNNMFKYINRQRDRKPWNNNKYILIPYAKSYELSFGKPCIDKLFVIEVDDTYDFKKLYLKHNELGFHGLIKLSDRLPDRLPSVSDSAENVETGPAPAFTQDSFLPE